MLGHLPFCYHFVKRCYWKVHEVNAKLRGTKAEEKKWTDEHLRRGNGWIMECWESRKSPHRELLISTIDKYSPFKNILEIGCNCGPNLYCLARRFPEIDIFGMDINQALVAAGCDLLEEEKISNVKLSVGKADDLSMYQDKSIDVVFTDAILIYISPDKIEKVIKEMLRVARKRLVFVEWHCDLINQDSKGLGIYYKGYWMRNYSSLLARYIDSDRIRYTKIPHDIWPAKGWEKYGYIIEATL